MSGRRHLVVVLPGIGGSVLARPWDAKVVWNAGFGDIADLLIHPAYNENTGTVLLEALVAGLPVLVSAVCGYAHYIAEADAGLGDAGFAFGAAAPTDDAEPVCSAC